MLHLLLAIASATAFAAPGSDDPDYLKALSIAQKRVETRAAHAAPTRAGVVGAPASILPRANYKVGDTWDVAAWHVRPDDDQPHVAATSVFRYRVAAVDKQGGATLEVREIGPKPVDSSVQTLRYAVNPTGAPTKSYVIDGHSVAAPIDGMKSSASALEAFPLDPPRADRAEKATAAAADLASVPASVNESARRLGVNLPLLSRSTDWFTQEDMFGRSMEYVWKSGDPWPAFVKTGSGYAVLIRKGAS